MAAAAAVYGLVLLLSPLPRTRLHAMLVGSAFAASGAAWVHFFWQPIPGLPATAVGLFIWIAAYASFKHRLALSKSIHKRHNIPYGRRSTDG